MELGTDDGIVAIKGEISTGGKSLSDTKVRYEWVISVDGRKYRIDFCNSKAFVMTDLNSSFKASQTPAPEAWAQASAGRWAQGLGR